MPSDPCVIATGKYEVIGVAARNAKYHRPPTPNPYKKGILTTSFGSSDEGEVEEMELIEFTKRFAGEFDGVALPAIFNQPTPDPEDGELTEVIVLPNDLKPETSLLPAQDGQVLKQLGQQAGTALGRPLPTHTRHAAPCMIGWGSGSDKFCYRFLGFALSVIFWILMIFMGIFIASDMFDEEDGQDHDQGRQNTTSDLLVEAAGLDIILARRSEDLSD